MAVRHSYRNEAARQRRAIARAKGEDVEEWGAESFKRPRND